MINENNIENEIRNYELSKLIKDLKCAENTYATNPLGVLFKLARQEIITQVMYSYKCSVRASLWTNRFRLLKEEYKRIGGSREFLVNLFETTGRRRKDDK